MACYLAAAAAFLIVIQIVYEYNNVRLYLRKPYSGEKIYLLTEFFPVRPKYNGSEGDL